MLQEVKGDLQANQRATSIASNLGRGTAICHQEPVAPLNR
jgi:hypothetical protein